MGFVLGFFFVKARPSDSSEPEGEEKPIWAEKVEERKNVAFTDYSLSLSRLVTEVALKQTSQTGEWKKETASDK